MKIYVLAASLRKDSLNKKLAHQVIELLKLDSSIEVDSDDFKSFAIPVYDGDVEDARETLPEGVLQLSAKISNADALIFAVPEYNGGISGALKNAIDWVSRSDQNPLEEKPLLLVGASPGALGAVRGLWHTRVPFEAMGTYVYPEMFGLGRAHQAFNDSGNWVDPKNAERLKALLSEFLTFSKRTKS